MKLLGTICFALLSLAAFAAEPIPDQYKVNGFAVGCQSYTFRLYSVMEAIDKTVQAGGKTIEFFPGQALSKDEPKVKFGHDAPPEAWEKVKAKCKEAGILPVGYGVVGLDKDPAKCRKVFDFAKALGIRVIVTESTESIDTFEKLVKEYDIKVGFHNHPKKPNDASYKVWDPIYVADLVKDRDPRIGACADIGHWVRSGLKPVECVKILKGRIFDSHMKDLHAPLPSGHDVHWGKGVSDVPAILAEFRAQNFDGSIHVEYESNWETNVDDAKACIEFVKNWKPEAK